MKIEYSDKEVKEFLRESNKIEEVYTNLSDSFNAYKYIIKQKELTIPIILKCHRLILENLNPRIAGKIRECDVYVGGRKGYPIHAIKESLILLIPEINDIDSIEIDIKENHIWFESIHPFEDGNGRTGRLIYLWQRAKAGLPMKIIYNTAKQSYYKWFKDTDMIEKYCYLG